MTVIFQQCHLGCREARSESLKHQRIALHRGVEVAEGDLAVLVVIHLLHRHLDQVLRKKKQWFYRPPTQLVYVPG